MSGPPLPEHGVRAPSSTTLAKLRALMVLQVVPQTPGPPAQEAKPGEGDANCAHHRPVLLRWAKLLKQVFDLYRDHCQNCGGDLKIIADILDQSVIKPTLTHRNLHARAPPRSAARGQALQAA